MSAADAEEEGTTCRRASSAYWLIMESAKSGGQERGKRGGKRKSARAGQGGALHDKVAASRHLTGASWDGLVKGEKDIRQPASAPPESVSILERSDQTTKAALFSLENHAFPPLFRPCGWEIPHGMSPCLSPFEIR
ncbi:conserved hypothetical protein [Coccidioides posadasii str. Silveira]|uniref:Uncharacterized protein n=1 Tax=Coccidioides posadasii (strain RMSCC 757 / Silveira) TaxID=443226 RepID=E9CZA0_COCPS|nr:conserved hypothetical protein [Coccidioides posadasii str. Silveira]